MSALTRRPTARRALPRPRLAGRAPGADLSVVLKPFTSLVGAQVIGSGLGFLFWVVAARGVPAATIGIVSAAVTAQAMLGKVATLGVGTHLIGELGLHSPRDQRSLLRASVVVVASAGLVLAVCFALVAGLGHATLSQAFRDPAALAVFAAGVAATAVGEMLDRAVLGARRSTLQVLRNLVAAGLRFPLAVGLIAAGWTTTASLLVCWALPLAVSGALVFRRLFPGRPEGRHEVGVRDQARRHGPQALRQHALDLSLGAGPLLMPVVAGATLAPEVNARFAVAWLVATFVFIPPYMLATALFSASVNEPVDDFLRRARQTIPGGLALSLALCAGAWLLGHWFLQVFGPEYADESALLLWLLVPAGLWMVVKDHLVALWRVQRSVSTAAGLAAGGTLLEVVGAAVGAHVGGAPGLCVGWLLALGVEAYGAAPLVHGILRAPIGSAADGTDTTSDAARTETPR